MATAFTHAFVGASIGRLAGERISRTRVCLAAATLSTLPDLDVVAFALHVPYAHPLGHRGLTHSLAFAWLVALPVGWALARGSGAAATARVVAVLAVAAASHGLLDAMTDAGLGVGFWIPFDEARHHLPWRPLATSPIGLAAFIEGPAVPILANELRWVWAPLIVLLLAEAGWRRGRRRPV